jgi:hypothetical protein
MNKHTSPYFPQQLLIEKYEKLRSAALAQQPSPGLSILLLRGMVSWIQACLCPEIFQPDHAHNEQSLSPSSHDEMINALTNMILSQRKTEGRHA